MNVAAMRCSTQLSVYLVFCVKLGLGQTLVHMSDVQWVYKAGQDVDLKVVPFKPMFITVGIPLARGRSTLF